MGEPFQSDSPASENIVSMIGNLFNIILVAGFIILLIRKPMAAILVFLGLVLLLPAQFIQFGFALGEKGKYISNLVLFVCLITGMYFHRMRKEKSISSLIDWMMLVYLGFVFLLTVIVTRESVGLSFIAFYFRRFAVVPLFFFVGKYYSLVQKNSEQRDGILTLSKFLVLVGVYISIFGLFEYFTSVNPFAELSRIWTDIVGSQSFQESVTNEALSGQTGFYRYSGVYVESTETPMMLMVILALLGSQKVYDEFRWGVNRIWIVLFLMIMIVLSGTRGVIIAMLLLLLIKVLRNRELRKYFILVGIIGGFGIFVWSGKIYTAISKSSFYESRISNEGTFLVRIFSWQQGFNLFLDHPLTGMGVGTPIDVLGYEDSDVYTTHNYYLDKLVFTGLLSSILFVGLMVFIWRNASQLYKKYKGELFGELAYSFLFLFVGLGIVYMANIEKVSSGSIFWFIAGSIDYIRTTVKA